MCLLPHINDLYLSSLLNFVFSRRLDVSFVFFLRFVSGWDAVEIPKQAKHTWSISSFFIWLASWAGQVNRDWLLEWARWSYLAPPPPPRTARCVPQENVSRKSYSKSFIDQPYSVKMAWYWSRSLFCEFMDRNPLSAFPTAPFTLAEYMQEMEKCDHAWVSWKLKRILDGREGKWRRPVACKRKRERWKTCRGCQQPKAKILTGTRARFSIITGSFEKRAPGLKWDTELLFILA